MKCSLVVTAPCQPLPCLSVCCPGIDDGGSHVSLPLATAPWPPTLEPVAWAMVAAALLGDRCLPPRPTGATLVVWAMTTAVVLWSHRLPLSPDPDPCDGCLGDKDNGISVGPPLTDAAPWSRAGCLVGDINNSGPMDLPLVATHWRPDLVLVAWMTTAAVAP